MNFGCDSDIAKRYLLTCNILTLNGTAIQAACEFNTSDVGQQAC